MLPSINLRQEWKLETVINAEGEVVRVYAIKDGHKDAKLLITEGGDREIKVGNRHVYSGYLK